MGNILDTISKDNTRFTVFENDQVLTADQLNDLFNYLDVQSRLTRTQAIGVGIVAGLEIGLLNGPQLAVSKGVAITTDGDLLQIDEDQVFDRYEVFEDLNARYPYFHTGANQTIPLFELHSSSAGGTVRGQALSEFEQSTATSLNDYAGILYLEDYNDDPDLCTGTDCDNKGITAVRTLRVLLIHKQNMRTLLESMPEMNTDYFSLADLQIPRVVINTAVNSYAELNAAFNNVLPVKDEITNALTKAYQVCHLIVADDFDNVDPTANWKTLIDQYFTAATTASTQYVYDFARDLSYAYNELREHLFSGDKLLSPAVSLFPKHILLGSLQRAAVRTPVATPDVRLNELSSLLLRRRSKLKFNPGIRVQRFNPVHIDILYRHHFYESPILNRNDDADALTRFCFMRIHCMITNFKVPQAAELQDLEQGLKITPDVFEDAELGRRSIPFYYRYDADFPINLYWNFGANNRKKERTIRSYFAQQYAQNAAATLNPLAYNLFSYNFFRIEGHIGFKRAEVEAALNKLILSHNLPINIQSVQVEKKIETIPVRPWYFPHLYMYEKSIRTTFMDRLDNADLVNDELRVKDPEIPVSEFKVAKQSLLDNSRDIGDTTFNLMNYRSAVSNVIAAATDVKAKTSKYTFSNTAIPHDFILNNEIIRKTDVISGIYQDALKKKKTGLMLGNYLESNPGLEHAAGVLRGGTFVLVYTADDQLVVADFMLPYANVDKDIVKDPPVYTPLPLPLPQGTPLVPRFPLDTVFEIKPRYVTHFDANIVPYIRQADLDLKVNTIVGSAVEAKTARFEGLLSGVTARIEDNSSLFKTVLTKDAIKVNTPGRDFLLAEQDFSKDVEALRRQQSILISTPDDDPTRPEKEKAFAQAADDLTLKLNNPAILNDQNAANSVKIILADVQGGTNLIKNAELQQKVADINNRANGITRGFNR